MFRPNKSHAEQSFVLNAPAGTVAQACQAVLQSIGSIKSVNRQTGLITGTISNYPVKDVVVTVAIYKETNEKTGVKVTTEREEAILTSGNGAQNGLVKFVQHLTQHPSMQGRSSSGW